MKEKSKKRRAEKENAAESPPPYLKTVIFLFSFLVYGSTCYRTLPGGDSAELVTASVELGVAHPPGYPLLMILLHVWLSPLIYLIEAPEFITFAASLFNSFIASLVAVRLYSLAQKITSSWRAALFTSTIFAFSLNTWEWASNLEVFTLNNLLCILLLDAMVDYFKKKEENEDAREELKRGIFYSGLALTNQHTSILFILPIALLVLLKEKISIDVLKTAIVTVAFPLSLYLYLPLSAYFSNAKWTWGDSTSIDGILTHVLRAEYGTFSLASGHAGRGFEVMMSFNARQFIDDFTIFGFVFGIFGIILELRKPAWRLIVIFAFYTWFFNWRCNLDPEQGLFKGVIQRFYLQSGIIFCIFIGIAADFALKLIEKKLQRRVLPVFILSVPVLVAGYRYEAMNYSRFTHVSDFADHLANSFPEKSIILMKGDLPSNSLRFVDVVEKRRPDCSFIDTQPMTYPWYIKMLGHHFPTIHFPGKRYHLEGKPGDFSLAEFIRQNPERNIFGCIGLQELEKIAKDGIWSMPWGVCEQFFVSRNFSSENWNIEKQEKYSSARLALSNWSHEPSEASNLPDHSWEKVANDEIYAAIVKSAMWSFDAAEAAKKAGNKEEAKQFYAWSYEFYKNAIEKMGDKSPSYWYKNAALIHPTAAQFLGKIENTGSYEETYEMFKTYLSQNKKLGIATDDEEAVKKAIDDIGKFLGK